MSIFTAERFEAFVGVARLDCQFLRLVDRSGNNFGFALSRLLYFQRRYDLINPLDIFVLARINNGKKLTTVFRNALLPVPAIYPYYTDSTVINSGELQRLLH